MGCVPAVASPSIRVAWQLCRLPSTTSPVKRCKSKALDGLFNRERLSLSLPNTGWRDRHLQEAGFSQVNSSAF